MQRYIIYKGFSIRRDVGTDRCFLVHVDPSCIVPYKALSPGETNTERSGRSHVLSNYLRDQQTNLGVTGRKHIFRVDVPERNALIRLTETTNWH